MKERKALVDLIRFIAMIAVLFIHCKFPGGFGEQLRAICSFAVPIFFITSGYFCADHSEVRVWKKTKALLRTVIMANIFYFIWDIFYVYCTRESLGVFFRETFNIRKLFWFIFVNESPLRGHLWFLGAILYCYLVLLIVRKLKIEKITKWFPILLIAGVVAQFIMNRISLGEKIPLLIRNWLLEGVPFFFIGFNYRYYRLKLINKSKMIFMAVFLVSAFFYWLEIVLCGCNQEYYGMTIVFSLLLFTFAVENDYDGKIVACCGDYYRKYGLMFYIIQVALIKQLELVWDCQGDWYLWCKPIIVLAVTMIVSYCIIRGRSLWDRKKL